jgi:hypothetical protein
MPSPPSKKLIEERNKVDDILVRQFLNGYVDPRDQIKMNELFIKYPIDELESLENRRKYAVEHINSATSEQMTDILNQIYITKAIKENGPRYRIKYPEGSTILGGSRNRKTKKMKSVRRKGKGKRRRTKKYY